MTDLLHQIYYRLPTTFQDAVLIRRRAPIWLRAGILFVHIPKAAGTSINQALYGRFMGHAHAVNIRRWGLKELNALPSFAITRNPWDRLVSAWRFARQGGGVDGKAGMRWPKRYRIAEFDRFDTFVTDWLLGQNRGTLDGVFQPQSSFVCGSDGKLLVDHVGKVEDLQPTLDFVARHLGSAPRVHHSNRSGKQVDYRTFYTDSLAGVVGEFYSEDICRFRYQFD